MWQRLNSFVNICLLPEVQRRIAIISALYWETRCRVGLAWLYLTAVDTTINKNINKNIIKKSCFYNHFRVCRIWSVLPAWPMILHYNFSVAQDVCISLVSRFIKRRSKQNADGSASFHSITIQLFKCMPVLSYNYSLPHNQYSIFFLKTWIFFRVIIKINHWKPFRK